jgi:hypothetical protein
VITLVLGIVTTVFSCCGGFFTGLFALGLIPAVLASVGSIVLGAMAMSSAPRDPVGAAKKVKFAWVCLGVWLGLGILGVVVSVLLGGALLLPAILPAILEGTN